MGPLTSILKQMGGAWVFYTCVPLPSCVPLSFTRIARWAPGVGLIIGALLGLTDFSLGLLQMPILPRSAIIVALWVGITGGLHLDGAMDVADGLAVMEPARRLEVMADSRSGAFGVMVAILILLLKVCALSAIATHRPLILMLATTWGRWGQVIAIATYPYLKPNGKGAFHHQNFHVPWDFGPGLILLLSLSAGQYLIHSPQEAAYTLIAGVLLSGGVGLWYYRQLRGMTGDVYGAIVEWTEALLLGTLTVL